MGKGNWERYGAVHGAAVGLTVLSAGLTSPLAWQLLALSVHNITYFTTDQTTGPLGFFVWDIERPHTIFINPIAGIVAVGVGIVLIFMARRSSAT